MRILHVTDCYLPQVGGIEMHVHDLAERQRRAGHDVHVLTSTPGGNVVDPTWVRRLDGRTPTGIGRSLAATRRVEEVFLGEPFDVVHAHVSVISPLSMSTARQAAARRVPTVVTVHSLWSSLGPVPPMLESLLRLRTWPVVWSAVSTVAAAALQETLGGTATVVSVPNGVDPDEWQPQTQPSDTQLTIACVMRLARRKRPMPLLRMLRRLRQQVPDEIDFRVVIIGDGPARPAMERFLRAHRMDGWVSPARAARAAADPGRVPLLACLCRARRDGVLRHRRSGGTLRWPSRGGQLTRWSRRVRHARDRWSPGLVGP